jgi:hypothetical protein
MQTEELSPDSLELQQRIIETLPSLEIDAPIRGIYFLIHHGRVVYVGQTNHVVRRLISHIQEGVKVFDSWRHLAMPSGNLNVVEKEFILRLQPKYNGASTKTAPATSKYRSINRTILTRNVDSSSRHHLNRLYFE